MDKDQDKMKQESLTEKIFWLAINCYHEARGEADQGRVRVCKVVLNRAVDSRNRWPDTVKGVIFQHAQFSWTLDKKLWPIRNYDALLACAMSATKAYLQWMIGSRLGGANHYYATYIKAPKWAKNMKFIDQAGLHRFFLG